MRSADPATRGSADDLVDIGDGDRKADQDMRAVARLVEQEFGAAADDLLAEGDEDASGGPQVRQPGGRRSSATMLAPKLVCSGVKR